MGVSLLLSYTMLHQLWELPLVLTTWSRCINQPTHLNNTTETPMLPNLVWTDLAKQTDHSHRLPHSYLRQALRRFEGLMLWHSHSLRLRVRKMR